MDQTTHYDFNQEDARKCLHSLCYEATNKTLAESLALPIIKELYFSVRKGIEVMAKLAAIVTEDPCNLNALFSFIVSLDGRQNVRDYAPNADVLNENLAEIARIVWFYTVLLNVLGFIYNVNLGSNLLAKFSR